MELHQLYQLLDITSLDSLDDDYKIRQLALKVLTAAHDTNGEFTPAAVCVFPNWIPDLKHYLKPLNVELASVAGGFPLGQTFTQVKMLEAHAAIEKGATEIDMVINRGLFLSGKLEECGVEIKLLKDIVGEKTLKVIIESGELETDEKILGASILALHVGADFVKTSTGKSKTGATPEAVRVICTAIRDYYGETGNKRGIKISGGVSTVESALEYCSIIEEILGESWLQPGLTRIGASKLANDILTKAGHPQLATF